MKIIVELLVIGEGPKAYKVAPPLDPGRFLWFGKDKVTKGEHVRDLPRTNDLARLYSVFEFEIEMADAIAFDIMPKGEKP